MREMKNSGVEWIGDIPKTWNTSKIKHHFTIGSGTTPKSDALEYWDGDITWVTPADFKTEDVYVSRGRRFLSKKGFEVSSLQMIPKGNIIFSKRAPIGQVVINNVDLCTNQGCLTAIARDDIDIRFYRYLMSVATEEFELAGSGTTFKEISASSFGNVILPNTTKEEQKIISNYLDEKCKKIDNVIAHQEEIIEKLKEYKLSIITESVLSGIDSGEMKKSGIDLCERIPEAWSVSQIRYLFRLRDEKNFRPLEDVQLLSLYTDLGVFPHGEQEERGNKAVKAEGYKVVYEDDIVVNIILAWMGAIGRSAYNGVTSPAYDIYKPLDNVCSKYYHYMFRTKLFSGECYKYGRGIMAMRWRTYSSEFKSIKVPVPPFSEQKRIAEYLDNKCGQIDKTITDRKNTIEKLKEYKKSLIYEVVTGKKEV